MRPASRPLPFAHKCAHDAPVWPLLLSLVTALPTPETHPCPVGPRCVGLRLFVTAPPDETLGAFLDTQIAMANTLFAESDVGFTVLETTNLSGAPDHITSREDRDELGHDRFAPGAIDVYIVSRLDDVDLAGQEIRGVHWRSRKDRERRFIILSTISPPRVLAHELGHFFGLPHSRYPESIMNKTPRAHPPYEERRFARPEITRIESHATALLRSGALTLQTHR